MRNIRKQCIDCGSEAIEMSVDEVKPVYRMEIIDFACGAVLKNCFAANGNVGRTSHSGCLHTEG